MSRISPTKVLNPKVSAKRMFMATLSTALVLITLFWAQNLHAAKKKVNLNEIPEIQQEAADFIQQLADEALTSLNQDNATLTEQEMKFRKILQEGFDVRYISKISLGRHRKQASREDLDNYYALFPEYLVRVYTSRLTKLDTREVRVGRIIPNGKRDMYVRTKVIDDEEKSYDVDWRVRPKKAEMENYTYKIIDVKIEGISMARTQRDDFTARISESGLSGLIDFMQSIVDDTVMVAENDTHGEKAETDPEQTR